MDTQRIVKDSVVMVQQMAVAPEEVLATVDLAGQKRLLAELPSLIEQADEVQRTGDGLLALAENVHQVVEAIPELAALFPTAMVGVRKSVSEADLRVSFSEEQVQEQAAQIYNSVVEFDQGIKRALHKLEQRNDDNHEQRSDDDHGRTNPDI